MGDRNGGQFPPFLANALSPDYLGQSLHAKLIPEGTIALLNANDFGSDAELVDALKYYRRVVALGGQAAVRLADAGRRADYAIRHPRYARRFQQHGDYAAELEEAVFGNKMWPATQISNTEGQPT